MRLMRFIAGAHGKALGATLEDMDGYVWTKVVSPYGTTSFTMTTLGNIYWESSANDVGSWYKPEGTPDQTYYIRCTFVTGSGSNSYYSGAGLNSWLALSTARTWSFAGTDGITGNFLWELATDSGGTNIISTATQTVTFIS